MSKLAKALTAAAGNAAGESLYVEDVFSTYLYTGTESSSQTITNGINLADEGGLVWVKARDSAIDNVLMDTEQGTGKFLNSNNTNGQSTNSEGIKSFNTDGFTFGTQTGVGWSNDHVYWTFRKAEKFFDVVTYTGTGSAQNIAHNLGVAPAVVIVKSTSNAQNWYVYHESLGNTQRLLLDSTVAAATSSSYWNNTSPTDSVFTVGTQANVNTSGATYVAYLFASDAGGFGDDGSESIIKCGSFTGLGNTTPVFVDLGFEPQWVLVKSASATGNWFLFDSMRGMTVNADSSTDAVLKPNSSATEVLSWGVDPAPTGFYAHWGTNDLIYIAIRRPMKTPESGTEVFSPVYTSSTTDTKLTTNFPVDMQIYAYTGGPYSNTVDRLRGVSSTNETYSTPYLQTSTTGAESLSTGITNGFDNTGFKMLAGYSGYSTIFWSFKRATGFFDVVAYTGGGSSVYKYKHNLGVAPELIIIKSRSNGTNVNYWPVKIRSVAGQKPLALNSASANPLSSTSYWSSFTDTATEFATRASSSAYDVNATGYTYIAYLFASVAGVSKVGSYTGTGSNVDVDCGFSAGARFILIKRTDSTGDWYVWDSARGIVAGNDPYLLLNSTAAEVTSTDYIDPLASGFTVTSSAPAALNASGGTYIFLAIA